MDNIKTPVLFCNGVEIDGGSKYRILGQRFAHPIREEGMFQSAMDAFIANGEFEWVDNNDVFLLKNIDLG